MHEIIFMDDSICKYNIRGKNRPHKIYKFHIYKCNYQYYYY